MLKILLSATAVCAVSAQIDRTCVDSNATRLINSQINPCLYTAVTEGNKVEGLDGLASGRYPPVVLAHGMFHGAWYWKGMQEELSRAGYESHAFTFQTTNTNTKIYELSAALYAFILNGSGADGNGTSTAGMLSKRPIIVAHSTAGHVVQHFMLTHALLLPAEIRPVAMVLMGSGCNDQPCDTISDAAVQARLTAMMADGSFNINSANCNTDMSKALFFANGTNTTDVSGTALNMAEYACKLRNEQGGAYCTYCVTPDDWRYTTTPAEVSRTVRTLVHQGELDIFATAVNRSFMIDHLTEQWVGATPMVSLAQAHVDGDAGWKATVAAPIISWMTEEAVPSRLLSDVEWAGVGVGALFFLILIIVVMKVVAKRKVRGKYDTISGYGGSGSGTPRL